MTVVIGGLMEEKKTKTTNKVPLLGSIPVLGYAFRNDDELRAIGIGAEIAIIFCFFPHDGDNVFLTISARALDKNLTIIAVIENREAGEKLIAAGANKIIDPYEICGRKIHELIKKPDMTNILDHTVFGRHDLNMAEIEIPVGSYLQDSYVCNLNLNEQYNLILIGIVDKELGEDLHFSISGHGTFAGNQSV
jgi:voltage-gated potassium channel